MADLQDPTLAPLIQLRAIEEPRGTLVAVQKGTDLPFEFRRVFYIVGLGDTPRGFHAHEFCEELIICVTGSCRVIVDNGHSRVETLLSRPDQGLHLFAMQWVEMHDFSEDCVLLVFASELYDEAEYIREYRTFVERTRG
jgi:dTDP-4-dehydrorhamnose 3,5-epimerase